MKTLGKVLKTPISWYSLFVLIILGAGGFVLFYSRIENSFVFYPQRAFDFVPESYELAYRDIYFPTGDKERLHGWFFPLQSESPVILFSHGNAGNISHRLDNIARLLEQGLQVFIFDYRGYGKSSGEPTEKGIYSDGIAAYDHLVGDENISPEQVVLFGRSLGASVAIEVALQRRVRALIIESAFTSTREMAKAFPLFYPIARFLPAHYHNLKKISDVVVPKLIVHGEQDEIVPFHMGRSLYAAAPEPKHFYPIAGAGHNDTYVVGGKNYFRALAEFARKTG